MLVLNNGAYSSSLAMLACLHVAPASGLYKADLIVRYDWSFDGIDKVTEILDHCRR